jgi:hypothetical protein
MLSGIARLRSRWFSEVQWQWFLCFFVRSLESSLYNKANELQEDISMKRFDLRVAQIHLAAVRAQVSTHVIPYDGRRFIRRFACIDRKIQRFIVAQRISDVPYTLLRTQRKHWPIIQCISFISLPRWAPRIFHWGGRGQGLTLKQYV